MEKEELYWDLETFSTVPIKWGTHAYAEGAEIMLFLYAFGEDGEIKCWDVTLGEPMPADLAAALADTHQMTVAHNCGNFDSVILRHTLGIDLPPNRMVDTFVQAISHGLPGSLDTLCDLFKIGEDLAKKKTGKALIRLFCMERPKNTKLRRATRETHPKEWQEFIEYGKADISSMRALRKYLPAWNYPSNKGGERNLWNLDQKINNRGVAIDVAFAQAAVRAADKAKVVLAGRCDENTNGEVPSTTQRDLLMEYVFTEYGIAPDDMRKTTVEKLLENPEIPEGLRDLLDIRLQASATSTAKYLSMIRGTSKDGRMRGTIQFCGAGRTKRECLAENTQVSVRNRFGVKMQKNIQDVLLTDQVWDGDEWVAHEGVVFSGLKDVIEHDGVVATSEHNVYISTSEYITLGEAKRQGVELWRGNDEEILHLPAYIAKR